MKKLDWSVIAGCLIVGIGIVIAGFRIGHTIEYQSFGSPAPGSLEVNLHEDTSFYGDYLNGSEAAEYLRMPWETFDEYLQSGKLDGMFVKIGVVKTDEYEGYSIFGEDYIFSRAKLNAFMDTLMDSDD